MKKQKKGVETAVQNAKKDKKTKTVIEAAVKKKVESSSSDDSSSESEQVSCIFLCISRNMECWNVFFNKKFVIDPFSLLPFPYFKDFVCRLRG